MYEVEQEDMDGRAIKGHEKTFECDKCACYFDFCNYFLGICQMYQITFKNIPEETHNSKRYMDPNFHCNTIYNSQDMEAT